MMIKSKIVCGYVFVLGVALAGTATGLAVGNHYQQTALQSRQTAARELKLLSGLQVQILYNRPAKQLSPHLADPAAFRQESTAFLNRVKSIHTLLISNRALGQPSTLTGLQPLLDDYEQVVIAFYRKVQGFVQVAEPLTALPQGKVQAENALVQLVKSPEFAQFIEFPDKLQTFYELASRREQMADAALVDAERLRSQIIVAGLLLSVAIAAVLTLYTSQAIARPIQTVTRVAQQVTQEANFALRVPIVSSDEMGILADALNQLIQQVNHLLQELKTKNDDLSQALQALSQQQLQLLQAEKMSSLGQLVAGVAHEINNPVNFIHGNLIHVQQSTQELLNFIQLFQHHYPNPVPAIAAEAEAIDLGFLQEDLPKMLASMKVGTDRICQIVLSLRTFARMDEAELKAVNIHEGIDSTLMLLQHRLKAHADRPEILVQKHYHPLPLVECFAGQLNQVLMNILSNAIDALEDGYAANSLHANAEDAAAIPLMITICTEHIDAQWVQITITDNGPGIAPAVRTKIFDPFFTTKPMGKGTGMGMSISYQIITENHKGQLKCVSEPGRGAEFVIQIPIQQPEAYALREPAMV